LPFRESYFFFSNGEGVFCYNKKTQSWKNYKAGAFGYNKIFHANADTSNQQACVWLGTEKGLVRFSLLNYTFTFPLENKKPIVKYIIQSMYDESKEGLWLSNSLGLVHWNMKSDSLDYYYHQPEDRSSLSYNIASALTKDEGGIWVGTIGGGLNRREGRRFASYGTAEGLLGMSIYGSLFDKKKRLWMSTNKGLSRYDGKSFWNYTIADGLPFDEFAMNSAYQYKGWFFFGGIDGVVFFQPNKIPEINKNAHFSIIDLKVNYKEIQQATNLAKWDEKQSLELFPAVKTLTMSFAVLDYLHSKEIRYQYRLEGFDEVWIDATQRLITYTSLPYGEYQLEIRYAYSEGQWHYPKTGHIQLMVQTPFYLKWWFILLEISFGTLLMTSLIWYFSTYNLRKRLQEEKVLGKIQQERSRISRELHDNIGARMTHIVQSLRQIRYIHKKGKNELLPKKIDSLESFSKTTIQELRDTMKTLQQKEFKLDFWISTLQDVLSPLLESINFEIKRPEQSEILLSPIQFVNLTRIVQEAAHNTIKYANASNFCITIHYNKQRLSISITDDGDGFELEKIRRGNGLSNMEQRMSEMKGEAILKSVLGEGTNLQLWLPYT